MPGHIFLKFVPHWFSLPKVFSIFLIAQTVDQDEEDTANHITLSATERESDQESNEIYHKKVNMFAFYQPLTVVNGIIFNYFYPAPKVLILNVAIFKWTDLVS